MLRPAIFALVLLAFALPSAAHAHVRSLKALSLDERIKLQESEGRLVLYDRTLLELDRARHAGKMSREQYGDQVWRLEYDIAVEAKYQDDILTQDSGNAEEFREVMENIAKYAVIVPAYIISIALRCSPGFSFSP